MSNESRHRGRIHMRMPKPLLEQIDRFKEENDLPTRTHAIIDLCKLGLEVYESKKRQSAQK